MNCLPEPPTFAEGGTKTDGEADAKFGPKESCWNCYKLFPKATARVCAISNKVSELTSQRPIPPHNAKQPSPLTHSLTHCLCVEILQGHLPGEVRTREHHHVHA